MTRRRATVVLVALLVVALLAAAPFVAEWPSSSHTPPSEGDDAANASAPRSEEPDPERRRPRQRSTEADAYAEFREYVAARRAAGKPTTLRELLGPDPPDAENAAVEINAALDALLAELGEESTWPKVGPWGDVPMAEQTPEQIAELREFVKRFGPFLDRVAAALDRPRCRFPVTIASDGSSMTTMRLMQRTCRVLTASAFADDDPSRRFEAHRSLLRLARKNEPVSFIVVLLGTAFEVGAERELRRVVEIGELDAAGARARIDDLLRTDWIATTPRLLQLELAGMIEFYERWIDGELSSEGASEEDDVVLDDFLPSEAPPAVEFIALCTLMDEAARLPSSPFQDYRRKLEDVAKRMKALGKFGRSMDAMLDSIAVRMAENDTRSRLARIALAASEHRATHGDFPASLDELKPMFPGGVPLNPLTDAPFDYERTTTGVRIATDALDAPDLLETEQRMREKCLVWYLKR